jgi:hypothetical protein
MSPTLDQRIPLEGTVMGSAGPAASPGPGSMTAADIFAASPGDPRPDDPLASFAAELAFHLSTRDLHKPGADRCRRRHGPLPGNGYARNSSMP